MQLGTADLVLTIAVQTALASSGSGQFLITKATVGNQDSVARTVSIYRVPFGGTHGAANLLIPPLSIPAGETVALPLSAQAVVGGATLQALASADNVVSLNLTYETVT
jgi:hypothetical protein